MPNNTTCQLRVTGPSVVEMMAFVKGKEGTENANDDFSCHSVIPMPEELRGTTKGFKPETPEETKAREKEEARLTEKYGHSNWYDWSCANWGTKWDAYSMSFGDDPIRWVDTESGDGVYVQFYTAWSPPLPVIAELARRFPDLTFTIDYADEGGGYAGRNVYKGDHCDENCFSDRELVEAKEKEMGIWEDWDDEDED